MIYPRPAESSAGRFRYTVFQLFRDSLSHGHIPAAVLLFFMIVLLVALSNAFLLDLRTEFAVNMREPCAALRQGVVLKDIRHVVE